MKQDEIDIKMQKELDYISNKIDEAKLNMNAKQEKYLNNFTSNLLSGIDYYNQLFDDAKIKLSEQRENLLRELDAKKQQLTELNLQLQNHSLAPARV